MARGQSQRRRQDYAVNLLHSDFKKQGSLSAFFPIIITKMMPKRIITKRSLTSEMDQSVKRMLKLVEEDGDSFAKKAEMYYHKRPELISLVEQFYRMYRSLAERYDHLTGELKKNIPSDLQSQGSAVSDFSYEAASAPLSPVHRLAHRKSGPRAAGFEVFLGLGGGSSDQKEGEESSSLTDSDAESDESSVNNYSVTSGNGGDQGMNRKLMELEIELREAKEKLRMQQLDENGGSYSPYIARYDNVDELHAKVSRYEKELEYANEQMRVSEFEIARLRSELETATVGSSDERNLKTGDIKANMEIDQTSKVMTENSDDQYSSLVEELRSTKEKLQDSENEIASLRQENGKLSQGVKSLQGQLESAQKDFATWKSKQSAEKRESAKLQEKIARLKTSLSDRDHEIRDLKIAVSDAEQKIFPEKAQIKAEISKLLEERKGLEEEVREWESRERSLEDEIRRITNEKTDSEARLCDEISRQKEEIAGRDDRIENLEGKVDALKSEREKLIAEMEKVKVELSVRDDKIEEMKSQEERLLGEQARLTKDIEEAQKMVDEFKVRVKEAEEEVETQRRVIEECGEEKREAIRQLCFSLEHYKSGYEMLRQAWLGHKRVAVIAR